MEVMTKTTKAKMATKTHLGQILLEFALNYPIGVLYIELFRHKAIISHTVSLGTNLDVHLVRRVTVVASQSLLML